jgi:hypothetical protein
MPAAEPVRRPVLFRATTALLLVAFLVPYALTSLELWRRTSADAAFSQGERQGLRLARPAVRLISATADAQTATITGRGLTDARVALQVRVAEVDAAQSGETTPDIGKRWSDVRREVETLVSDPPSAATAFTRFAVATSAELTMLQAIADSSNLILDPQLDSYYLMDAVMLRVPRLLVDAGRFTDLAAPATRDDTTVADSRVAAGVLADRLQSELMAINDGLRKTFDATDSPSVGPAVLGPLDRLVGAASALAPPLSAVGGSAATTTAATATAIRPAADLADARARTRDAALALEQPGMDQLDLLLAARQDDLAATRGWVTGTAAAGALLAFAVAWARSPRRRSGEPAGDDASAGSTSADDAPGGSGQTTAGPGSEEAPADPGSDVLAEAQHLLDSGRLVRVGRAVAPARDDR